ncbi:MAG TPA: NUDIX domain-containing protein [Anaerolineales bacterium]|nr:NUDIX domain-containing protein [Anaerolineales bacterium]
MKPGKLRAIAICVFRSEGSIFVFEGRDEEKDETFYRPLGGTIEFGEYSIDTVQRELREEIEEEIRNIRYLGMLENVFRYEGEMGHEIVIIYEADFVDPTIYEKSWVTGYEDDGKPFRAVWKPMEHFKNPNAPLYPHGLLQLLTDP